MAPAALANENSVMIPEEALTKTALTQGKVQPWQVLVVVW